MFRSIFAAFWVGLGVVAKDALLGCEATPLKATADVESFGSLGATGIYRQVEVQRDPSPFDGLPFIVENYHLDRSAFNHLVGSKEQQRQLLSIQSSMHVDFVQVCRRTQLKFENRPGFVIFGGASGTGKTAHARAFAQYNGLPLIQILPSHVGPLSSQGQSVLRKAVTYALHRKSAVVLIEELDSIIEDNLLFETELWHLLNGDMILPDNSVITIIGTTKDWHRLPRGLHRLALQAVWFGKRPDIPLADIRPNLGWFSHEDYIEFWTKNAMHLSEAHHEQLAQLSKGKLPGDLILCVRRAMLNNMAVQVFSKVSIHTLPKLKFLDNELSMEWFKINDHVVFVSRNNLGYPELLLYWSTTDEESKWVAVSKSNFRYQDVMTYWERLFDGGESVQDHLYTEELQQLNIPERPEAILLPTFEQYKDQIVAQ